MKDINNKKTSKENRLYDSVNNYTKYKLVEMWIEKYKDKKIDNLNAIEQLADDTINVLHLCGMKYYQKLHSNFKSDK